jgi:hypothetical protein
MLENNEITINDLKNQLSMINDSHKQEIQQLLSTIEHNTNQHQSIITQF